MGEGCGFTVQSLEHTGEEETFMEARYIVNENGERVEVILNIVDFERLLEELEELDDIRAYREAKATLESGEDELIPYEQAREEMEKNRTRNR